MIAFPFALVVAAFLLPSAQVPPANANAASPRAAEQPDGGDPLAEDRDGDGLADDAELHKYLTDPARADSDGDGLPDGDWDERREYAYTIRSVLDVCPPVTEAFLDDDFQDARVLVRADDHVRLEVIHYPFSTAQREIPADPDWRAHVAARPDLRRWLAAGPTSDVDDELRGAVVAALAQDGIDAARLDDRTLVQKVSRWLLDTTRFEDGFTTYTATFRSGAATVLPELAPALAEELRRLGRTGEQQWSRELSAKGMFRQRVHGSCTSTAILWSGVFRALGLPTRTVLMVPVVDASDPDELALLERELHHHRVRATVTAALPASRSWSNHTFNEVFVGGRWRRLNYDRLGQGILDRDYLGLMTHVATVADWADGDFARTYGVRELLHSGAADAFGHANPYSCVELSDRFGVHAQVANPELALTIDALHWSDDGTLPEFVSEAFRGHPQLIGHIASWTTFDEIQLLTQDGDARFFLESAGHPTLAVDVGRGGFSQGSGADHSAWIALTLDAAAWRDFAKGVEYKLRPQNSKRGCRWSVASGTTVPPRK